MEKAKILGFFYLEKASFWNLPSKPDARRPTLDLSPPISSKLSATGILNPHLIPKVVISSFSSSIALHPRLHNWKDVSLSIDIVDLIEGNPQPKFILDFRILIKQSSLISQCFSL